MMAFMPARALGAPHLLNAFVSLHFAQPQLICIGVLPSFQNISHFESGEFLRAIGNFFNFKAHTNKSIKDVLQ
jgi:hypothetical protein